MKKPVTLDLWSAGICLLLCSSACLAHYVSGRFRLFFIIPPGVLVAFAASLFVALFVIWQLYRIVSMLGLRAKGLHLSLIAIVLIGAWIPWHTRYELFRLGRSHHIKNTFDEAVIAEVLRIANTRLQATGSQNKVELSSSDLPAKIGNSAWGFPGYVAASKEEDGEVSVSLGWGISLIGHHGLHLTHKIVPENGFPSYSTNDNGKTVEIWTQTYTPWVPYGYIVHDRD